MLKHYFFVFTTGKYVIIYSLTKVKLLFLWGKVVDCGEKHVTLRLNIIL